MKRAFIDANVFLYALGADHPYRPSCQRIMEWLAEGRIAGESSVEVVQELLHVSIRHGRDRAAAVANAEEVAALCRQVLSFEQGDLTRALALLRRHERLRVRDSVHAATALNHGIDTILSADREFDGIAGLERIDPADEEAVRRLTDEEPHSARTTPRS